ISMPAIALTAYARDEDRQRALAAGFQCHLAKPVEPCDLAQAIADLAKPIRAQGVYISDQEIQLISRHWTLQGGTSYDRHAKVLEGPDRLTRRESDGEDIDDERYEEAVEIIRHEGKASVSMLQRKMTIGFARAGRLIDIMERNGVVGPDRGPGKFREVYGSNRPGEE
ncbi:MAG TPA: DNA translocase FtsK, partial [Candidatus Limnocylindria bacterium]|nr:DNA translocase FtsK [Candidatus Limnocylindria bacterium]